MRHIAYAGQRVEVEIVSLVRPRNSGLMGPKHPLNSGKPNLTLRSPVELPIGAHFQLDNAHHTALDVRVLGCTLGRDGRFVVLGLVQE
jgi:hypothetical protein